MEPALITQLNVVKAFVGESLKVEYGKQDHVNELDVQLGSTLPRKVMNEYDPIGKFLLLAVLVGDEAPTEVPDMDPPADTPEAEGLEDEADWWDEVSCVVDAECAESSLGLLAYYEGDLS